MTTSNSLMDLGPVVMNSLIFFMQKQHPGVPVDNSQVQRVMIHANGGSDCLGNIKITETWVANFLMRHWTTIQQCVSSTLPRDLQFIQEGAVACAVINCCPTCSKALASGKMEKLQSLFFFENGLITHGQVAVKMCLSCGTKVWPSWYCTTQSNARIPLLETEADKRWFMSTTDSVFESVMLTKYQHEL